MSKGGATNVSPKNYKRNEEPEGKCNGFNIEKKRLYNKWSLSCNVFWYLKNYIKISGSVIKLHLGFSSVFIKFFSL